MATATSRDPLLGFRRRPDIVARQVGFDVCLYDPATDRVHVLNPVAAAVWYHVTPDRSFEHVVDALWLTFRQHRSVEKIAADLRPLVTKLKRLKLIVPVSQKPPKAKKGHAESVTLPDQAITSVGKGYVVPDVKTFTVAALEREVRLPDHGWVAFSDTWTGLVGAYSER